MWPFEKEVEELFSKEELMGIHNRIKRLETLERSDRLVKAGGAIRLGGYTIEVFKGCTGNQSTATVYLSIFDNLGKIVFSGDVTKSKMNELAGFKSKPSSIILGLIL